MRHISKLFHPLICRQIELDLFLYALKNTYDFLISTYDLINLTTVIKF